MSLNLFKIGDRVQFNRRGRTCSGCVGDILLRSSKAREDGRGDYNYFIVVPQDLKTLPSRAGEFYTIPENELKAQVDRPCQRQNRYKERRGSRERERGETNQ